MSRVEPVRARIGATTERRRRAGNGERGRAAPSGSDPRAGEDRPLILVADDFSGAREVYARLLSASGYRVAEAKSGEEALEKAIASPPALILMDLVMPGMDGWEAIRRLRSDVRTNRSCIVIITATSNSEAAQIAKKAGCDAYLLKPVLPETLLEVVRSVLAKC